MFTAVSNRSSKVVVAAEFTITSTSNIRASSSCKDSPKPSAPRSPATKVETLIDETSRRYQFSTDRKLGLTISSSNRAFALCLPQGVMIKKTLRTSGCSQVFEPTPKIPWRQSKRACVDAETSVPDVGQQRIQRPYWRESCDEHANSRSGHALTDLRI